MGAYFDVPAYTGELSSMVPICNYNDSINNNYTFYVSATRAVKAVAGYYQGRGYRGIGVIMMDDNGFTCYGKGSSDFYTVNSYINSNYPGVYFVYTGTGVAREGETWYIPSPFIETNNALYDIAGPYLYNIVKDKYPITYRLTNCTAPSAPTEAVVGDTVTVPITFPEGYGIVNPSSDAYVTCNGVLVPSTYSNGQLVFTMPNPS